MEDEAGVVLPPLVGPGNPSERFLGVIPIAQAGRHEQFVIILSAIERYTAHSRLYVMLHMSGNHPEIQRRFSGPGTWPGVNMTVTDDPGTVYQVAGTSGGGSDHFHHAEFDLTPAIPTDARALTITISDVTWTEHIWGPHVREPNTELTPGPWIFTADLSRQLDAQLITRADESA